MADKKISALTAATTPLAGTEVLPIVQSGSTVKVANNDLRPKQIQSNATSGVLQIVGPAAAATRVMTTPDANFTAARTDAAQSFTGDQTLSTGNLIQGSAAKGVNFTANTPAAGMTSQLLNWYEEGTWTPAVSGMTITNMTGTYTRMGNVVVLVFNMENSTVSGTPNWEITGIPFTNGSKRCCAGVAYDSAFNEASTTTLAVLPPSSSTISLLNMSATGGWNESQITTGSGRYISFVLTYRI